MMREKLSIFFEKAWILLALIAALVFLVFVTYKVDYTENGEFVYTLADDGYAAIDGYSGSKKTLEIPETIDGYTVKYISKEAFANDNTLKKVIFPKTLESIGKSAFQGCKKLKAAELPEGLVEIGDSAFFGCSSLKNITIPDSVLIIRESAFENCKSLKRLDIPDDCNEIGTDAFLGCENLILGVGENETAKNVAQSYNIPTSFSESSDSTMLKAGLLFVVVMVCVFVFPGLIKKASLKARSQKKHLKNYKDV